MFKNSLLMIGIFRARAQKKETFMGASHFLALIFCLLLICTGCQKEETPSKSILRVSTEGDAQTLDPRRVRDLATTTVIHMLYEGLLRNGPDGQPGLAMAESMKVSPDQMTYTFQLRKSNWSDGEPVTAKDFEETWKSILDPKFPSPNAYQLYSIRGAQAAKEGRASLADIGVKAVDNKTLVVTLERPTPYLPSLLATHFFYPVHPHLREQPSDSSALGDTQIATNGPFILSEWHRHDELTAVPNSHYWDRPNVRLDQISLIVLDNPTALQLFQGGGLEWTGSPLSTISTDALASLKKAGTLDVMPAAGTYLLRVNTEKPPFTSAKMRAAFALAINRSDLVEHVLQGNQIPAFGIVPPSFIEGEPLFADHDRLKAHKLFREALDEQQLTVENFPPVTLYYASGERSHKIAQVAQQQWKEAFGITAALQSNEAKVYFDQLKKHDYQMGIGSWFADFRDPISFLEVFKLKDNGTNNTQWEHLDYVALLDNSSQTTGIQRNQLLKDAEALLIREMPVIPLFYASYNYVKSPSVKGVYFSELGYLDFKNAYLEP